MKLVSAALGLVLFVASTVSAETGGDVTPLADGAAEAKNARLSDAQIRKILIAESIAAYEGNCPCPYNIARNGSRCGKRSAYSRAGGESPLCYPEDVTQRMVEEYRAERSRA